MTDVWIGDPGAGPAGSAEDYRRALVTVLLAAVLAAAGAAFFLAWAR